MNFRRWGPAVLLLGWTQLALTDEPAQPPTGAPAPVNKDQPRAKEEPKTRDVPMAKEAGPPLQIPYRLTNTQHILVRVKINGKGPFNFIVDTGAPIMILASEPAKQMGFTPGKNRFFQCDRVEIEGGAVLEKFPCLIDTPFQFEAMNGIGIAGRELHGLLGYTALSRFRMEIDLTRDKMVWTPLAYKPAAPQPTKGGAGGQAGLEAIGKIAKMVGFLIGARMPESVGRGFVGIELGDRKDGAIITAVLGKSPAEAAGLKTGDEIVEINSKAVRSPADVLRLTAEATAGRPISIVVRRDGRKQTIRLTPGDGL